MPPYQIEENELNEIRKAIFQQEMESENGFEKCTDKDLALGLNKIVLSFNQSKDNGFKDNKLDRLLDQMPPQAFVNNAIWQHIQTDSLLKYIEENRLMQWGDELLGMLHALLMKSEDGVCLWQKFIPETIKDDVEQLNNEIKARFIKGMLGGAASGIGINYVQLRLADNLRPKPSDPNDKYTQIVGQLKNWQTQSLTAKTLNTNTLYGLNILSYDKNGTAELLHALVDALCAKSLNTTKVIQLMTAFYKVMQHALNDITENKKEQIIIAIIKYKLDMLPKNKSLNMQRKNDIVYTLEQIHVNSPVSECLTSANILKKACDTPYNAGLFGKSTNKVDSSIINSAFLTLDNQNVISKLGKPIADNARALAEIAYEFFNLIRSFEAFGFTEDRDNTLLSKLIFNHFSQDKLTQFYVNIHDINTLIINANLESTVNKNDLTSLLHLQKIITMNVQYCISCNKQRPVGNHIALASDSAKIFSGLILNPSKKTASQKALQQAKSQLNQLFKEPGLKNNDNSALINKLKVANDGFVFKNIENWSSYLQDMIFTDKKTPIAECIKLSEKIKTISSSSTPDKIENNNKFSLL